MKKLEQGSAIMQYVSRSVSSRNNLKSLRRFERSSQSTIDFLTDSDDEEKNTSSSNRKSTAQSFLNRLTGVRNRFSSFASLSPVISPKTPPSSIKKISSSSVRKINLHVVKKKEDVIMEGELEKAGARMRGFSKRKVTLTKKVFRYSSSNPEKKPPVEVPLHDITSVNIESMKPDRFNLYLRVASLASSHLHGTSAMSFRGASKYDVKNWCKKIKEMSEIAIEDLKKRTMIGNRIPNRYCKKKKTLTLSQTRVADFVKCVIGNENSKLSVEITSYDENGNCVLDEEESKKEDIKTLLSSPPTASENSEDQNRLSLRVRRVSASCAKRRESQQSSTSPPPPHPPPLFDHNFAETTTSRNSLQSHDFNEFYTPDANVFGSPIDDLGPYDDDDDDDVAFIVDVSPPPTPPGSESD